jgi:Ca-activated chloride channel family protein
MTLRTLSLTLLLSAGLARAAFAQGLVVPVEPDLPPLGILKHRVETEIHGQAAQTTLQQVFVNRTNRLLEAQYVFPIPRGASLSRFTMLVDGREQAGELVEKDEARRIYQSIVSRSQDPGLLEYLGGRLFRASIFPIAPHGTQTVTLRYEQVLEARDGLTGYLLPFRPDGRRAASVDGEASIEVRVKAAAPILNLYSPTHPVLTRRTGEAEAVVTWSARGASLDRDFQLFYSVDPRDIGLSLLTYRPDPARPGYFLLLAAPRSTLQQERLVERDMIFVVDTSGSMAGAKIRQAREALKYCLRKLNDGDRFTMISFASHVDVWKRDLVGAAERREEALHWADTLIAQGGTNISGALDEAFAVKRDASRPAYVIFMTDGKPTMGEETSPGRILQRVARGRAQGAGSPRLFTWGLGYDVDTHLLDALAAQGGGVSEYVRPEEDIAVKVAAFADRASRPALTGPALQMIGERVKLSNVLPRALPDLFAGGQLVMSGRYTGEGDAALEMRGRVNGREERFVYEGRFPAAESGNAFVELLWAQRRIGDLLDEIRLNGESKELLDDVIRLSKEYGIPTPYTSALILEEDRRLGTGRTPQERASLDKKLSDLAAGAPRPASAPPEADARRAEELEKGFRSREGKDAVESAKQLRQMKEKGDLGGLTRSAVRKAAGTRFSLWRGIWVDERFAAKDETLELKFGGEAYFKLLERAPGLLEALKLGSELILTTAPGRALVITGEGRETLTDAEWEAWLGKP